MKTNLFYIALAATTCLTSSQLFAQNKSQNLPAKSQPSIMGNLKASPDLMETTYQPKSRKVQIDIFNDLKSGKYDKNKSKLGPQDGGGGKVVLEPVYDHQGNLIDVKTTVLDLFEAKDRGLTVDTGPSSKLSEKLDYVLTRFAKVAPFRAAIYRSWAKDLLETETHFKKDYVIPVTDDAGLVILPKDSQVAQIAIQLNRSQANLPFSKRYFFDEVLFNLLDSENKLAIILHEVIYREARNRNAGTSEFSRYLTGLILSKEISNLSTDQFNNEVLLRGGTLCFETGFKTQSYCEDSSLPSFTGQESIRFENKIQISGVITIYQKFSSSVTNIDGNFNASYNGYPTVRYPVMVRIFEGEQELVNAFPGSIKQGLQSYKIIPGKDPINLQVRGYFVHSQEKNMHISVRILKNHLDFKEIEPTLAPADVVIRTQNNKFEGTCYVEPSWDFNRGAFSSDKHILTRCSKGSLFDSLGQKVGSVDEMSETAPYLILENGTIKIEYKL